MKRHTEADASEEDEQEESSAAILGSLGGWRHLCFEAAPTAREGPRGWSEHV